ncbi:MAG: hypothetical protein J5543_04025 [Bacteroidales bacterium]|nr:hypothetical protein [Bacteroidales bacterium]
MRAKPNIKSIASGLFNYRLFFTLLLFVGCYTWASGSVPQSIDYSQSETASVALSGTGTADDPYMIYDSSDFSSFVTDVNSGTTASASYKLGADVTASGFTTITTTFSGTLEADINPETQMPYRITNLDAPLFSTLTGTVKNLVLEDVSISGNTGNTGAIACTAEGAARIYNVGILSGEVGGTTNTGGLVGFLNGTARVVNCYSYANITGGTDKGGIVGYNNVVSSQSNVATMVMNCLFYGTIASGGNISPIFGGQNIDNKNSGGLATYNYYLYRTDLTITNNKYNCALAVEEKFFTRFELFRQLENSNKKLASIYATGSAADADSKMLKWVLETADRTISDPKPYPILKAQGRYPSIINYDANNAPDSASVGRNHGGQLGKTLSVTISGVGSNAPVNAEITKSSLTLQRTDKDFDRFNFNYDKVQLPYYNDVGSHNYTGNRVVTGWKITSISGGTEGTFTAADTWGGYNFADRKCTNKDLYSISGRVFSQGAYFDVPYGVTAITIEPYWGVAAYVSDQYYDVVYKENGNSNYSGQSVNVALAGLGAQASNNSNVTINGSSQKVYTSINNARTALGIPTSGKTVYDYAVVLVGNVHQAGPLSDAYTPYTITSVDLDQDNEPDYSFIFSHHNRQAVSPIRFDFLNVVGTAQAQKPNGTSRLLNVSIFKPKGWFEVTNTCNIYFVQFEGDNGNKTPAPIIFLGGVFDQFTSTQNQEVTTSQQYIHLGSNAWFKTFGNGTHGDGWSFTSHVPVSVTGGDFEGFYLSGVYRPDAGIQQDDAECYISSGRFNEVAGAAQQMIDGDVHWQIYNADITNFYGGGLNAAKPITGDITVDITNSCVETYCGGPKFGDMQKSGTTFSTKYSTNQAGSSTVTYSRAISKDGKVTTNATGCEFNNFFGAGYGGTSYSELKFHDATSYNFSTLQNNYTNDRGKYFTGQNTQYKSSYGNKGPGVATDFSYEFFIWSTGLVGARFYVKYASFSLAQCNDVESKLKDCIINTNFYGGGSIGKVVGTATSELENCTVSGSVYAGGYSASLPTIPIRSAGFTTLPKFNNQSGMFEPGVFSDATDFDWTSGTLTENATAIDESGGKHDIFTDVDLTTLGEVEQTNLTIKGTTTVGGSVYGGGEESAVGDETEVNVEGGAIGTDVFGGGKEGDVGGSVVVNMQGGSVTGSLYGGGALANTNIKNVTAGYGTDSETIPSTSTYTTTVNLLGGTISGDAYGGGLGRINVPAVTGEKYTQEEIEAAQEGDPAYGKTTDDWKVQPVEGVDGVEALVYGDVNVNLGSSDSSSATAFNISYYSGDHSDVVKSGRVFGCNNLNGSPKGTVLVKVYKTSRADGGEHAKTYDEDGIFTAYNYEVQAVYGGGNLAAYDPIDPEADGQFEYTYSNATVIHDNTGKPVQVVIDGCEETSIEYVYGGGNAAPTPATDVIVIGSYEIGNVFGGGNGKDKYTLNGGTNWKDNDGADVGYKGTEEYGSGKALASVFGGTVHSIFGGSNTKGDIRVSAEAAIDKASDCPLVVDEIYGGGNEAYLEGDSKIVLGCIDYLREIYGGAKNADIGGDIELTITSGHFDRIFGGNNLGGNILGSITVNIEETGCNPITIGELYGCGNAAAYTTPEGKTEPTINIKSFTSIGRVFGGGLGEDAVVTGNPIVNINEVVGANANMTPTTVYAGTERTLTDGTTVILPEHDSGEIGAIGTVFGGGNAAAVHGNTTVNVGTEPTVTFISGDKSTKDVVGVDIRGNIYGGGNAADVTGSTNVVIGQ